ncbi:ABC transporter ATP-binding protein [Desulfuromonas versatilis]|uniref:ABC transporter ATP-binding protein n=1 Tax=Desulfuromonas versatilis TaxID=2802975 RepID=A0ABN6DY39_9BACT|nr:ABC transporter ATP-binding protein [Desulfuromonas versatilis]BCR04434.1 ABC transporter ATP-binding protein [Desulfuromonas versatilis]
MIELTSVTKTFNQGRPNEFTAVRDVSLSIEGGKVSVLQGPSGSGKTTLLSLIGCMARPTAGRIRLSYAEQDQMPGGSGFPGGEVTSLPERFLTAIRRHTFGFIFQHFHLVKGVSALENVMLPAYPNGEPYGELKGRAGELLQLFGIAGKAQEKVDWLSGGEIQRVAIARALINDPAVIIADEPTAHLDTQLAEEFVEILAGLKHRGKTIVIASHDPLVYQAPVIDRVVRIRDGRVERQ